MLLRERDARLRAAHALRVLDGEDGCYAMALRYSGVINMIR